MVSKHLNHFERILSYNLNFNRSHKSWIITLSQITSSSKSKLEVILDNRLEINLSKFKKRIRKQRQLNRGRCDLFCYPFQFI